ncbi:MAG: redoxin domain-containing protein [Planctomycetaceae bacterium]|nr:redoxin domain-containing protein [Planctomycetaceae bacterium]
MKPRILVLPLAGIVIAGLCLWRLSRNEQPQIIPESGGIARRPAPLFELRDQGRETLVTAQQGAEGAAPAGEPASSDDSPARYLTEPSKPVRLKSYLGRHRIILVFFDNEAGADKDPVLAALREHRETIQKNRIIVLGISTALPQHNRQALRRGGEIPFPLLTDLDGMVCQTWGVLNMRDDGSFRNRPAVFAIDRSGTVAWKGDHPQPVADPLDYLDSLLSGE